MDDRADVEPPRIAVIGGTGFYSFFDDAVTEHMPDTPYGTPSAPVAVGSVAGRRVAFLPRHGRDHEFSAHSIPYRANMWALRALGVRQIFGPCAVGSLRPDVGPGAIVVPDQLVDRTSGRNQTYFDRGGVHVGFADPYCPALRKAATRATGAGDPATMVVIEGPRFSTRAESQWYAAQGWHLVNMTGHPEAVLARELDMCYATLCLVTDLDAGVEAGTGVRTVDIIAEFRQNIGPFKERVREAIAATPDWSACTDCRAHEGVTLPFELP